MSGWRKRTIMEMAREVKMPYDFVTGEPINLEKTKALIDRLKIGCFGLDPIDPLRLLLDDVIEALAQPEQEPVAYMDICEKNQMSGLRYWSEPDNRHEVALYTSPPAQRPWVGLTLEELSEIYNQTGWDMVDSWGYERAIEAKLKEKNT